MKAPSRRTIFLIAIAVAAVAMTVAGSLLDRSRAAQYLIARFAPMGLEASSSRTSFFARTSILFDAKGAGDGYSFTASSIEISASIAGAVFAKKIVLTFPGKGRVSIGQLRIFGVAPGEAGITASSAFADDVVVVDPGGSFGLRASRVTFTDIQGSSPRLVSVANVELLQAGPPRIAAFATSLQMSFLPRAFWSEKGFPDCAAASAPDCIGWSYWARLARIFEGAEISGISLSHGGAAYASAVASLRLIERDAAGPTRLVLTVNGISVAAEPGSDSLAATLVGLSDLEAPISVVAPLEWSGPNRLIHISNGRVVAGNVATLAFSMDAEMPADPGGMIGVAPLSLWRFDRVSASYEDSGLALRIFKAAAIDPKTRARDIADAVVGYAAHHVSSEASIEAMRSFADRPYRLRLDADPAERPTFGSAADFLAAKAPTADILGARLTVSAR